jgi:hypothetical protein
MRVRAVWDKFMSPLLKDRRRIGIQRLNRMKSAGFASSEVRAVIAEFERWMTSLRISLRLRVEAGDTNFESAKLVPETERVNEFETCGVRV